jgi:hypothetical protein
MNRATYLNGSFEKELEENFYKSIDIKYLREQSLDLFRWLSDTGADFDVIQTALCAWEMVSLRFVQANII